MQSYFQILPCTAKLQGSKQTYITCEQIISYFSRHFCANLDLIGMTETHIYDIHIVSLI